MIHAVVTARVCSATVQIRLLRNADVQAFVADVLLSESGRRYNGIHPVRRNCPIPYHGIKKTWLRMLGT